MTTRSVTALAAILLTTLVAGPNAAADAPPTGLLLRDGTGDVWATPVGGDATKPAGARRAGDIARARLTHGEHALVVRLRFVDLSAPGRQRHELFLRTPAGRWSANVVASRRAPEGRHRLWRSSGDRVRCPGMTHDVDLGDALVQVRIPRACLGAPHWVRVVATTFWEGRSTLYRDHPHGPGPTPAGPTRRLYRG